MADFEIFKKKQYVSKALSASFWTIFGAILPLLFGTVILFTYSQPGKIIGFIDRGDFCLYSAGLLSSALFILSDNKENARRWHDSILYPITFVLIIIGAALYCAIYIGGDLLTAKIQLKISIIFVRCTSFVLIISAIIITYRSLIIDFRSRSPNIDAVKNSNDEVQNILNQL